jgi:hypothetical protein
VDEIKPQTCGNTPYDEGPFSLDQERNAFEAAMRKRHPEWSFTVDPVFDYHNERTRCAWEAWQAAGEQMKREQAPDLRAAAEAVLDRWNSPKWEWHKHGPTADLMGDLAKALEAGVQEVPRG